MPENRFSLKSGFSAVHKRTPLQSNSAAGFRSFGFKKFIDTGTDPLRTITDVTPSIVILSSMVLFYSSFCKQDCARKSAGTVPRIFKP